MISWNSRFAMVVLLLAGTALFLQGRARHEFVMPRTALATFPFELEQWAGTDVPIPEDILKTLRPGDFLQRTYRDRTGAEPYVDLYVAYLLNQHTLFRHLPQDCLTGSGWTEVKSDTTMLALPGESSFAANRYLIAKGDERQLVLFWYAARGRRVASEDWIDVYLAFDSLRLNRSDNALIRINTAVRVGETPEAAERRLLAFAALAGPLLKNYIPL